MLRGEFIEWFSARETIVILLFSILSWFAWKWITYYRLLPPGPWGVPLFGYLAFLGKTPHIKLAEMSKKYGSVFSIRLGSYLVVVLGSHEVIKEALVKQGQLFAGRPFFSNIRKTQEPKGILMGEGPSWKAHRRFSLQLLKDFSAENSQLEQRVKLEIECFLQRVEAFGGKAVDLSDLLRISVSNIIHTFIFGVRCDCNDTNFQELVFLLDEHVKRISLTSVTQFLPWTLKIPGINYIFKKVSPLESAEKLCNLLNSRIKEFREKFLSEREGSFIHSWLTNNTEKKSLESFFSDKELNGVIRSLLIAGTDTTTTTLLWSFIYIVLYPDVQKKVQNEIDNVIGRDRLPSMSDRERMPYTMASIQELHRMASILPLSVSHANLSNTTLNGFFIPKRAIILPHLWLVHHNPSNFHSPEMFQPERFLDDNGSFVKNDLVIPFSLGKRRCLGENFAQMVLFLYFTSFFQKFTISPPSDAKITQDINYAAVVSPKPFKLCAHLRK